MVGRLNRLEVARLDSLLFGSERTSLQPVREPLLDLQGGVCFYCRGRLRSPVEVDHFVPWSSHPDDRLDNLVVAHPGCNRDKRDFLASPPHLAAWARRLADHDADLDRIAHDAGWPREGARSLAVLRGTYLRLPDGVALWHRSRDFVLSRHDDLLGALAPAS